MFNSFITCIDLCCQQTTLVNSLDSDQDGQNVGRYLGPNRSTLCDFFKKQFFFLKKQQTTTISMTQRVKFAQGSDQTA